MLDDDYRPKVKVKRSSAGLGLFLEEAVQENQMIIEYTGDRITADEANERGGRYLFEVTDSLTIDGRDRKNTARYINHACEPNAEAEHDEDTDRIFIRSKEKMEAGTEISIDYGETYMEQIIGPEGCRCAACKK